MAAMAAMAINLLAHEVVRDERLEGPGSCLPLQRRRVLLSSRCARKFGTQRYWRREMRGEGGKE